MNSPTESSPVEEATKVVLQVETNLAYEAGELEGQITLKQLSDMVKWAMNDYGPDAEVVVYNGDFAGWGTIVEEDLVSPTVLEGEEA